MADDPGPTRDSPSIEHRQAQARLALDGQKLRMMKQQADAVERGNDMTKYPAAEQREDDAL